MKTTARVLAAAMLILAFLMPAATADTATKPDPFGRMPETVTFTIGRSLATDPKLPEGETIENNDLLRKVEDMLNVKMNVIWTTSDMNYAFENKVNLLIASADIPDVLQINTSPYGMSILRKLVDNDLIQDLTQVYEDYASDSFRDHHANAANIALKSVTYDGKLMAIPNLSDTESSIQIEWVRQDWLDKLGLAGPKTVDDLATIAQAFMGQDFDGNGQLVQGGYEHL
ncbi:MAG TPA: hypothetical protein PKE04_17190 [Clostridia bacterium]|nr:hypothetical protein [Clostridia bacterium]